LPSPVAPVTPSRRGDFDGTIAAEANPRAAVLWSWRLAAAAFALAALAGPVGAASSGLRLVHAEDFSTAKDFDPAFWIAETGFFRNREAQYYRPENVGVQDGALVLEGRRESALNADYSADGADWLTTTRSAEYTSGSIVSRDAFTFGVFEVVARLPQGAGDWPAIWLVNEQGLPYREIDLVEAVGNLPGRTWTTIHAGPDQRSLKTWQAETPMPGLERDFHTYRLEWRKDSIAVAIDGRDVLTMNPEEAHRDGVDPLRAPMHLRVNLALGGSWGGRIDDDALPARLEVRSIKIWSVEPQTSTSSD
jgi:beta-glucanase (GH16 family)